MFVDLMLQASTRITTANSTNSQASTPNGLEGGSQKRKIAYGVHDKSCVRRFSPCEMLQQTPQRNLTEMDGERQRRPSQQGLSCLRLPSRRRHCCTNTSSCAHCNDTSQRCLLLPPARTRDDMSLEEDCRHASAGAS